MEVANKKDDVVPTPTADAAGMLREVSQRWWRASLVLFGVSLVFVAVAVVLSSLPR